jgi:hypothetical protein
MDIFPFENILNIEFEYGFFSKESYESIFLINIYFSQSIQIRDKNYTVYY